MPGLGIKAIFMALTMAVLLHRPVRADAESCIECHLHRSFVEESGKTEVKTLAGFHGRVLVDEGPDSACGKCHGSAENAGEPPAREVCTKCHTRGKAAQGDPRAAFHAEKDHWSMEKVSCTECHKGHVKGIPDIKFLTTDVVNVCGRCHEKSFDFGKPLK